jgi:hypothetical protein
MTPERRRSMFYRTSVATIWIGMVLFVFNGALGAAIVTGRAHGSNLKLALVMGVVVGLLCVVAGSLGILSEVRGWRRKQTG